jgi:uncharacterized protein (TIGR03435 family)
MSSHPSVWKSRFFLLIALLSTMPSAFAQAVEQVKPMPKDAAPVFEVATIKPSDPDSKNQGFQTRGHRIACINETVNSIVSFAYGIHVKQIAGAPAWFDNDHFDIAGTPDVDGYPDLRQMQQMYRKLLAERFHLKFHREQRELPIYALTVAKDRPSITPSKGLPEDLPDATGNRHGGSFFYKFTNVSMAAFALNLNFYVDRPIVDQTGLSGRYDFTLNWTFDDSRVTDPNPPPSLFTAVREQLGLKLEAVKGPAEVFVVDQVERPTEN